jgi:hypothetical protein
MRDWTVDKSGRSNASPQFIALVAEVDRLIRNSGRSLITGHSLAVARVIVAQLAHVHGLAPTKKRRSGAKPK